MTRKRIYYPESQILSGLTTEGGEFMTPDNIEYIGAYHKYSDGAIYTGGSYTSNSKLLIKYRLNEPEVSFLYDKIAQRKFPKKAMLAPQQLIVTEDDYKIGIISRYFAVRINDKTGSSVIEISKKDYDKFRIKKSSTAFIYNLIEIKWKLTGPKNDVYNGNFRIENGVYDTNKRIVESASQKTGFSCLKNVIIDYLRYSVYDVSTPAQIKNMF